MITLEEYKQYLNIVETENDSILQGFITAAVSQLDSLCNRKFLKSDYTEIVDCNVFNNMIFLKNTPINSITSVKYYDGVNYVDVTTGTLTDYYNNCEIYLQSKNTFSLYGKRLQVVYNGGYKFTAGTGALKVLTGSANVLGLFDTVFTDEVTAGDYLSFDGLRIKVLSVTDDTHLILESPVSEDHISVGYTISNVPEDLRQGCKELATKLYYDSGIGNSTLLKSSESLSGQTSGSSVQLKELDMKNVISNYRFINV